MSYNTNTFLDNLQTLLIDNISDLSTDLYKPLHADSIKVGNPARISRGVLQYPAVIITLKNKTQEIDELGVFESKTSREIVLNVEILALTMETSNPENADKESRTLARNIETLLEKNLELSQPSGWHLVLATNTDYDESYIEESQTYQSTANVQAEFRSWAVR